MATWSIQASADLTSFSPTLTDPEVTSLRRKVDSWADIIGTMNHKDFKVRRYIITARARQHEVMTLTMDA
jgi:hypothetical protein